MLLHLFGIVILLICIYTVRHYCFTLNRVMGGQRHPGRITPFHRTGGKPGKAAALKEAMAYVKTELFLVFDADYIPGKALIRQLVSPFFDPEVGSVMGRVVPLNVGKKLLTRLLDL